MNDQEKKIQDQSASEHAENSAVTSQNNGAADITPSTERKLRSVAQSVTNDATKVSRPQEGVKREYKPREHRPQGTRPPDTVRREPQQPQEQQRPHALEELNLFELNIYARRLGIIGAGLMKKDDCLKKFAYIEAHPDLEMEVEGVLEKLPDGFGFLRSAGYDYISGPDDVYVSPSQIRRFNCERATLLMVLFENQKKVKNILHY